MAEFHAGNQVKTRFMVLRQDFNPRIGRNLKTTQKTTLTIISRRAVQNSKRSCHSNQARKDTRWHTWLLVKKEVVLVLRRRYGQGWQRWCRKWI